VRRGLSQIARSGSDGSYRSRSVPTKARATVSALPIESSLRRRALSGHVTTIADVPHREPFGQRDCTRAIAERRQATHRHGKGKDRQPHDRDDDQEHGEKGYAIVALVVAAASSVAGDG
jgi:hypothetical protein